MQNGLRHSSVVRMEKERGGVEASKGIGVRGERGSSIQRSLSTHLCEAVCANLTSPASPPAPSLPLSLSLSLSLRGVTPSMWVMTIAAGGIRARLTPWLCTYIWFKLAKTAACTMRRHPLANFAYI